MEVDQRTLIFAIGFGFLGYLIFNTLEASVIGAIIGFFVGSKR